MSETLIAVRFTDPASAEVHELGAPPRPGDGQVAGRTLYSLVSPGTELNWRAQATGFPFTPGYAAAFEVTDVGAGVGDVSPGDVCFCLGGHQSHQCHARADVVPVPAALSPATAPFARYCGISMTTLSTTAARPPEPMIVTGLGIVGNMAAQVFRTAGYRVGAVDPDAGRRALAQATGCGEVFAAVPLGDPAWQDMVGLVLDCSGHEAAAIDGAKIVRKRGEVVLLGTPWQRKTERYAHELTHLIFHRYVVVRSGWEWELPRHPRDFAVNSIYGNYVAALGWLADGRIQTAGLTTTVPPTSAPEAYGKLMRAEAERLSYVFDWSG